ncbi:hypothetical protein BDV96DRAFT_649140 [Lophiotrema nucula]|uniref:F-box domain-containing protein n=1 Tax=Lophiotrema nucula TaxID=690887 RepID=A0A6A5YYV3_9PLEO|nr:hypothetical protein BDV96DRAFT_649140 [Lophiotrema nucula]
MESLPTEILHKIAAAITDGYSLQDGGYAMRCNLLGLSNLALTCSGLRPIAQEQLVRAPILRSDSPSSSPSGSFHSFMRAINTLPQLKSKVESISLEAKAPVDVPGLRNLPRVKTLELQMCIRNMSLMSLNLYTAPRKLEFQHIERLRFDSRIRSMNCDSIFFLMNFTMILGGFTSLKHLELYGEDYYDHIMDHGPAAFDSYIEFTRYETSLRTRSYPNLITAMSPVHDQLESLVLPRGFWTLYCNVLHPAAVFLPFTKLTHLDIPKEAVLGMGTVNRQRPWDEQWLYYEENEITYPGNMTIPISSVSDPIMSIPASIHSLKVWNGDGMTVEWVEMLLQAKERAFPELKEVTMVRGHGVDIYQEITAVMERAAALGVGFSIE